MDVILGVSMFIVGKGMLIGFIPDPFDLILWIVEGRNVVNAMAYIDACRAPLWARRPHVHDHRPSLSHQGLWIGLQSGPPVSCKHIHDRPGSEPQGGYAGDFQKSPAAALHHFVSSGMT